MAKKAIKTDALGQKLTPDNFTGNNRDRDLNQNSEAVEGVSVIESTKPVAESTAVTEQNAIEVAEPKTEQVAAPTPEKGNLATVYAEKTVIPNELRTKRIQVVVTPSIEASLNELVANRKIRSKNDLINFLLESYLSMVKEDK